MLLRFFKTVCLTFLSRLWKSHNRCWEYQFGMYLLKNNQLPRAEISNQSVILPEIIPSKVSIITKVQLISFITNDCNNNKNKLMDKSESFSSLLWIRYWKGDVGESLNNEFIPFVVSVAAISEWPKLRTTLISWLMSCIAECYNIS